MAAESSMASVCEKGCHLGGGDASRTTASDGGAGESGVFVSRADLFVGASSGDLHPPDIPSNALIAIPSVHRNCKFLAIHVRRARPPCLNIRAQYQVCCPLLPLEGEESASGCHVGFSNRPR